MLFDKDRPKLLIADDEEYVRSLLKNITESIKFDVVGEASNGQIALELFREHTPDVMILDLNMPKISGDELLEIIKDEIEHTCIVIMTSSIDDENIAKCTELGAKQFIRKDTPLYKMAKIINDAWRTFESKRTVLEVEKYDLNELLQEIKEDKIIANISNIT